MEQEYNSCGFYDTDLGCTCSSMDKWYACPLELNLTAEDFEIKDKEML